MHAKSQENLRVHIRIRFCASLRLRENLHQVGKNPRGTERQIGSRRIRETSYDRALPILVPQFLFGSGLAETYMVQSTSWSTGCRFFELVNQGGSTDDLHHCCHSLRAVVIGFCDARGWKLDSRTARDCWHNLHLQSLGGTKGSMKVTRKSFPVAVWILSEMCRGKKRNKAFLWSKGVDPKRRGVLNLPRFPP